MIMRKEYIYWLVVSAGIMLMLPWMAVTFVKGDAAMAACFLLFYAVNPIYAVFTGVFAGKDMKYLWSLPVILAIMFLCGTWIFFDIGETAFLMYAAVYLILGIAAMLVSVLVTMFARKRVQG